MLESDLPNIFDTTLNQKWLLASAVIAIACVITLFIVVIKELSLTVSLLIAAFMVIASGIWGFNVTNINQEEQNTIIRAWISETYDLDESVVSGNISRELGNSRTEAPTFVDDEGRALSLITTVEGRLALVDAGGRELPHADSE